MTMTKLLGSISVATVLMCHVTPARASAIQLNNASELSPGGTVVTYPQDDTVFNPPFGIDAGGVTLTFSTPGFFNIFAQDGSFAPDFPADAILLADLQQGPLTITFSTGIGEVGFFAQGLFPDIEAFTFSVFHGASTLGTFNTPSADNTELPGVALFIGARATNGDLITRMEISNTGFSGLVNPAFVSAQDFDPSFVIGPLTFGQAVAAEPVPEPGSLMLLGGGLLYGARRLRRRAV